MQGAAAKLAAWRGLKLQLERPLALNLVLPHALFDDSQVRGILTNGHSSVRGRRLDLKLLLDLSEPSCRRLQPIRQGLGVPLLGEQEVRLLEALADLVDVAEVILRLHVILHVARDREPFDRLAVVQVVAVVFLHFAVRCIGAFRVHAPKVELGAGVALARSLKVPSDRLALALGATTAVVVQRRQVELRIGVGEVRRGVDPRGVDLLQPFPDLWRRVVQPERTHVLEPFELHVLVVRRLKWINQRERCLELLHELSSHLLRRWLELPPLLLGSGLVVADRALEVLWDTLLSPFVDAGELELGADMPQLVRDWVGRRQRKPIYGVGNALCAANVAVHDALPVQVLHTKVVLRLRRALERCACEPDHGRPVVLLDPAAITRHVRKLDLRFHVVLLRRSDPEPPCALEVALHLQ
mmetsp:Transcript_55402/g.152599  ORF Transcript_55402/g.152599 Transcript_55402/m.152599 type:complete len:412 (-) Transcript_55402:204-1439(-)